MQNPELIRAALASAFDDFKTLGDPVLETALAEARAFCCEMASGDRPARWITFLGVSGTGKTMLARRIKRFFARHLDCLLDERNQRGEAWKRRGGFKPWCDVVRDMIEGDFSGLPQLRWDWFLVLDDVGTEYKSHRDLATSKLFEVMTAREGLWTVFTANIPLDQIGEKLDTRIASRLLRNGSVVCDVNTKDFNVR